MVLIKIEVYGFRAKKFNILTSPFSYYLSSCG